MLGEALSPPNLFVAAVLEEATAVSRRKRNRIGDGFPSISATDVSTAELDGAHCRNPLNAAGVDKPVILLPKFRSSILSRLVTLLCKFSFRFRLLELPCPSVIRVLARRESMMVMMDGLHVASAATVHQKSTAGTVTATPTTICTLGIAGRTLLSPESVVETSSWRAIRSPAILESRWVRY
ncbi:hypothetical protein PIB30_073050 [Stylosanthes scabra]|uniref:Uncharacterized protein n=1 Tax=Stylosanthes scabra TaxID=79078 RepID=A0ABU6WQ98_9FABA|nr:hypothetical protein [Stylosanthes scabra]